MNYIIERSNEEIKSVGGLCLIGRVLEGMGFSDAYFAESFGLKCVPSAPTLRPCHTTP
ncbi:MAG: hypothetical protein GXP25_06795 [Planctomycetes bacterium]|nr:hypothetical protein [Planctomycetota bacterium]